MSNLGKALGKRTAVAIGDRTLYFKALTLNDLVELQERGVSLNENSPSAIATTRYMLWLSVRHEHKDMTEQELGDLLTVDDMATVLDQIYPDEERGSNKGTKKKEVTSLSSGTASSIGASTNTG